MPNRARDLVGYLNIGSGEIHVVSNQRRAGSNGGYPGGRMDPRLTEVRPSGFVVGYVVAYAFKLTLANGSQILSLRSCGSFLIKVDRDTKLARHTLPASSRERDALVHSDSGNRDEGNHVGRAHARMLAGMCVEVDQLSGFFSRGHCGIHHALARPDECYD